MEILSPADDAASPKSQISNLKSELALMVNDTDAVYPIRIDPTFSDANWISMGGLPVQTARCPRRRWMLRQSLHRRQLHDRG